MARDKATITLDRAKVRHAMALTGADSMSGVIDMALDGLLHRERVRRDIEAYGRSPVTDEEISMADGPMRLDLDDDDVDYDALYGSAT